MVQSNCSATAIKKLAEKNAKEVVAIEANGGNGGARQAEQLDEFERAWQPYLSQTEYTTLCRAYNDWFMSATKNKFAPEEPGPMPSPATAALITGCDEIGGTKKVSRDASFQILPVDPETFSAQRISEIRHNFHEHPLMQLPELAKLAKELCETEQCRFIAPGCTQATPFFHRSRHPEGRGIDEVFSRIEESGSWVALYHVETHPAYKKFLYEVTDSFRPLIEREQSGIFNVGGFIFISAPPSVTPFHIDRENNFWLQIKGRKTISVWNHTDRKVVEAADVERFILYGSLENVRLKDGDIERGREFDVGPGDGVYFPCTSPHATRSEPGWARPGDGVCVSIGVIFYTDQTRFVANVHAWNCFLRRLGLSPRDAGGFTLIDRVKYLCGRGLVWGKKTFRGYKPSAGLY